MMIDTIGIIAARVIMGEGSVRVEEERESERETERQRDREAGDSRSTTATTSKEQSKGFLRSEARCCG